VIGDVTFTSLTGTLSIFDISVSGWGADGSEVASQTLFPGGEPDSAISITSRSRSRNSCSDGVIRTSQEMC
jgi:hypothetical protein